MYGIALAFAMIGLLAIAVSAVHDKMTSWSITERLDIEGYPRYTLWKGMDAFGSFSSKGQAESVMRKYQNRPTSWKYDAEGSPRK